MDDLRDKVLAELKSEPDRHMTMADLSHLGHRNDVMRIMIDLYKNCEVTGEIENSGFFGIISMKSVCFSTWGKMAAGPETAC